jgi:hypothetical protein
MEWQPEYPGKSRCNAPHRYRGGSLIVTAFLLLFGYCKLRLADPLCVDSSDTKWLPSHWQSTVSCSHFSRNVIVEPGINHEIQTSHDGTSIRICICINPMFL